MRRRRRRHRANGLRLRGLQQSQMLRQKPRRQRPRKAERRGVIAVCRGGGGLLRRQLRKRCGGAGKGRRPELTRRKGKGECTTLHERQ